MNTIDRSTTLVGPCIKIERHRANCGIHVHIYIRDDTCGEMIRVREEAMMVVERESGRILAGYLWMFVDMALALTLALCLSSFTRGRWIGLCADQIALLSLASH
jgi:hypothetical protein